jgi:hypothetical protein
MDTPMLSLTPDLVKPGNYRVKVGQCFIMDTIFGREAAIRFDLLEEGLTHLSIDEWPKAVLIRDKCRSRLYSWISALLFDGKPLPEEYTLSTASLLGREALARIILVDYDGLLYNRILSLDPLQAAADEAN